MVGTRLPPHWLRAFVAACAGGTLLGLAFAGEGFGVLAWIALVPWLLALRRLAPPHAFAMGWLGGLVAAIVTFGWLSSLAAFGAPQFALLGGYVALYAACWCAGTAWLWRQRRSWFLFAPALWVALDLARNHAGFLALPIASLGQSQHANPALLQLASLGGEAAVTAVVVLGNVAIAALVERRAWRNAGAAGAVIVTAHAAGAMALPSADDTVAPIATLAAVQPDIGLHERETPAGREAIWQRLEQLSVAAAAAKSDLIVWPETAVGDPRHDAHLAERLAALSRRLRVPLIVGASETEKFAVAAPGGTSVREREAYNAAYLLSADAPIGAPYRKRRLMPFGEYTPLDDVVAWPRWLVPAIAQGRAGDGNAEFSVAMKGPRTTAPALQLGVVICWENLFAGLSRDAVREGARVLVQLTNDAWFGPGRAATQHNAASIVRAAENGVPLVLASNAGPSLVIDAHGRVVARTAAQFSPGLAVAPVALGRGTTLFNQLGDWFAVACVALALCALLPRKRQIGACRRFPSNVAAFKEFP